MPRVPRTLRPPFDGSGRVGTVLKLERIAVNDSVVSEPECGSSGGNQHELQHCLWLALNSGAFLSRSPGVEVQHSQHRRHRRRKEPSVITRQAGRGKTQTAFRQRSPALVLGLAEINYRPDEECQV